LTGRFDVKERERKMKVTVLLGGDSPERDVSLASGMGIVRALRGRGHEVRPLDPAVSLERQIEPLDIHIDESPPDSLEPLPPELAFDWLRSPLLLDADAVFVGLHGGAGENGTVQALLEAAGVAYTGTGVLGSALAMNKDRSKAIFRFEGVQTAEHLLVRRGEMSAGLHGLVGERLGFPVVVKPNDQGSSVGFSFVEDPSDLEEALGKASLFHCDVIIERFVAGREITASILGGTALPLVEVIPDGGFYDYKRKYTKGASRYVAPAELDENVARRFQEQAVLAYDALCCRDYARVDFRMSEEGEPYCLEVNTLPGMTELSLVPMAAGASGVSFDQLVERICMMAGGRAERGPTGQGSAPPV
jgi:D-alanine-D-alanine ligase